MQQLIAVGTNPTINEASKKLKANNLVGDPLNAFLVTSVQFGLTVEELRSALAPISPSMHFAIDFLLSEEVLLRPIAPGLTDRALEGQLTALKPAVSKALSAVGFGSVQLCRVDESLNIERRESDSLGGGWSQVAAKAAAPRKAPVREGFGVRSSFVVLGRSQGTSKKKEKEREKSVVEDWEQEMDVEEEDERRDGASREQGSGDELAVNENVEMGGEAVA
jgi:transcriptional repressor NF-X1